VVDLNEDDLRWGMPLGRDCLDLERDLAIFD
jgi:hypothetical protein